MLAFSEWVSRAKRKKKKDECRSCETHREIGNLNQQREVAGGNQTEPTKQFSYSPSLNAKVVTVVVTL